jgi:DNA-binding NarL/FixJ family response regulator
VSATDRLPTDPPISHEDLGSGRRSGTDGAITVAVIEDNRVVREALSELLNRCPELRAAAQAPNSHESVLSELGPDVILLDPGLENGESLRIARGVRKDFPEVRIVLMDLSPAQEDLPEEDLQEFVSAGVSGFIMRDAPVAVVLETIRSVASGLTVLPDQLTAALFSRSTGEPGAQGSSHGHEDLRTTPREREVMDLVAQGLSNRAIGKHLHISVHTVKSHLRNIMDKLTLTSRLQIAAYVLKRDNAESE